MAYQRQLRFNPRLVVSRHLSEILTNQDLEEPVKDRYRQIAEDYVAASSERKSGGAFNSVLVVSPTHREANHVDDAIRQRLKESGKLAADDVQFTTLIPLNLTEAERGQSGNYLPGEIVRFHQNAKGGFKRGERVTVTSAGSAGVMVTRSDGSAALLPFTEVKKFQVYRPETLALAKGDRLRITMNGFTRETRRGALGAKGRDRLNNGAAYEIENFTPQGDIKLTNGFIVPRDYGGLAHGYVVTAHSSQGRTVDQVLIALGSESFNAANRQNFYVAASRGRSGIRVYTDDKAAMMDAVQASSARLSATELMQDEPSMPKRKSGTFDRVRQAQHTKRAYNRRRARIAAYDFITAYETHQRRKDLGHER